MRRPSKPHGAAPPNPIALCLETPAPPLQTPSRCASKPQVRRASKPLGTKFETLQAGHRVPLTMCNPWMTCSQFFVLRTVSGAVGTTRGDAKDPPMKKKKLVASQGQIISRAF